MLKFIDVHSHIHIKEYDADREEVIARMNEAGVSTITVGTDLESSRQAVELAEKHDNIWATIGVHPTDTEELFNEKDYENLVQSKKVVAIGECGLDYYRLNTNNQELSSHKERQRENFKKQIEFALKIDKPLMIHCRPSNKTMDAHEEMIEILTRNQRLTINKLRGNIHFFTGTSEIAQKYFNLGFTVSLSGVVTFANELEEMVKSLPLENILSETDCPYATPVPLRGKRNEPAYVVETVKYLAKLHNIKTEELADTLYQNARRTFSI